MKLLDIFKRKPSVLNDTENMVKPQKTTEITKEEFRRRKQIIDEFVDNYIETRKNILYQGLVEENKKIHSENTTCSLCKSTDSIVNKFVKKGVEVFTYNHCNNCGHEWNHEEPVNLDIPVENIMLPVGHFLDYVALRLFINNYDPTDITCEYDSAEEMEMAIIEKIKNDYPIILNFPLEVIYCIGYKIALSAIFEDEIIFGCDWNNRYNFFNNELKKYTGHFTEKMEDILINKLGVKKLFN